MFRSILSFFNPVRIILLIIGGILLWFLIWGDQGIYQREKMRYLKSKLEGEKRHILKNIEELKEEKRLLKNKNVLEKTIRKELGYIRPGEVIFELKNTNNSKDGKAVESQ